MTQLCFDFAIDWDICRPIRRGVRRVRRTYATYSGWVQLALDLSVPLPQPKQPSIWRRIWITIRKLIRG